MTGCFTPLLSRLFKLELKRITEEAYVALIPKDAPPPAFGCITGAIVQHIQVTRGSLSDKEALASKQVEPFEQTISLERGF